MTEETDQQPAAAETGPLTESAAAELLQNYHEEEEDNPRIDSARANANAAEEAAESAAADPEPQEDAAPEAEEAEEGDTDAEGSDDSYAHGNQRTRLRDGTTVTVGELKKLADKAREFERQQVDFDAKRREIEAKVAQASQQEQHFASTIQQAIDALQQTLPPEPTASLRKDDPIEYFLQKDAREQKLNDIGRLQQAQQAQAAESQAKQAEQFQERLKEEQAALYKHVPELRDESKRREFYKDLMSLGDAYGFSAEDINGISNHKVMLMARDAMAYRKLQAAKPKAVEKGKTAKPVARPDARAPSNARVSGEHKKQFERAMRTRSIDDFGALLAEID